MKLISKQNNNYTIAAESEADKKILETLLDNQSSGYVRAAEAMKMLGITRQTLCHYATDGKIQTVAYGGQYKYSVDSILELMK